MDNLNTRQTILDAAKSLLWEKGYEGMSPRNLMDASGVGQGSLYHYFRTKRDVAIAALAEVEERLAESAERQFADRSDPLGAIRAYLELERDGLKGCRIGRLAQEKSINETPELLAITTKYFTKVQNLIENALALAVETGRLPQNCDIRSIATAIVAIVQGGFVVSRATGDETAILRATRGAVAMLDALTN